MKKLKKDEISVIKLSQDKILELIREEVFHKYNLFGNISNKNVLSSVCYVEEKNGSVSMIAGFQRSKDVVARVQAGKTAGLDFLKELDLNEKLTEEPIFYSIKEIKNRLKIDDTYDRKENINSFVDKLKDEDFQKFVLAEIDKDPDYLEYSDIYEFCRFDDKIESEKLYEILQLSKKNKDLQDILPFLLYYSDAETITDKVFECILKFPVTLRNSMLISLAHCRISFYQLQFINDLHICTEAFCQLFAMYCEYPCFSSVDLQKFVQENIDLCKMLIDKNMLKKTVDVEKLNILKNFIK